MYDPNVVQFWGGRGKWKRARERRGTKIFRLRTPFFLWGGTENRQNRLIFGIFRKTIKFLKKGTPKFFLLRRTLFQKIGRSIWRNWSVKGGGVKNILYPLLDNVCIPGTNTDYKLNISLIKVKANFLVLTTSPFFQICLFILVYIKLILN